MIPKSRGYKRVGKGMYVFVAPAAVTRRDVRSNNWPAMKAAILQNIGYLYSDALTHIEQDVRNKK